MECITAARVSNCTGCRMCEAICSLSHEGDCCHSRSRIRVMKNDFTGEVIVEIRPECDLCGGEPRCLKWCPAGVLKYSKKGECNA